MKSRKSLDPLLSTSAFPTQMRPYLALVMATFNTRKFSRIPKLFAYVSFIGRMVRTLLLCGICVQFRPSTCLSQRLLRVSCGSQLSPPDLHLGCINHQPTSLVTDSAGWGPIMHSHPSPVAPRSLRWSSRRK